MNSPNSRQGVWYALMCFIIWGSFPIYWYPLNQSPMPATQILAQRVLWSGVFAMILLLIFRQQSVLVHAFRQPRLLAIYGLSSGLIAVNWLVYLWAILHHRVVEASLGYFINPLVNIFLGWLVFKEQMGRWHVLALILASIGVLWLAILGGTMPWVAILLAGSFGLYAMIRKLAPMDALAGLTLETLLLLPFAGGYLLWCGWSGQLVFGELNGLQMSVLLCSGMATTIPLLCFNAAAKRIPMSLLGILQYVSPTMQMVLGLLLFQETMDGNRLIAYLWVWLGVAVFLWAMWRTMQQARDSRH